MRLVLSPLGSREARKLTSAVRILADARAGTMPEVDRIKLAGPSAARALNPFGNVFIVWHADSLDVPHPPAAPPRSIRYHLEVGHADGTVTRATVGFDGPLGELTSSIVAGVRRECRMHSYMPQAREEGEQGRQVFAPSGEWR